MKFSSVDFQQFKQLSGSKYPYTDILTTRRSYHVKWLIVSWFKDRNRQRPIPSSAFTKETVNYLICTKQALPVPSCFDNIIEYVELWGVKHHSELWYTQCIEWIAFLLKEGIRKSHLKACYECIEFRVRNLAHQHAGLCGGQLTETAMDKWVDYYLDLVNSGETDFVMMLIGSCNFMHQTVESLLQSQSNQVAPVPVTPVSSS